MESREMPRYKCHKEVWALKIKEIKFVTHVGNGHQEILIVPEDEGFAPIPISSDYYDVHKPISGGYYVVYSGGYKSFSPAAEFEAGYSLI